MCERNSNGKDACLGYKNKKKSTYNKEHLPLVLVWQQEQTEDGGVGDLVVKGLTVEVKESRVDTDVVSERGKTCYINVRFRFQLMGNINEGICVDLLPSSGCKTLQLFEDTHSVSCGLDHISLRQHILSKRL